MKKREHRPWGEIRRGSNDPARQARVAEMKQAMADAVDLTELREARGATQVDLAKVLGVHQGNVSRLERRGDLYLSTLREYVEALGGELELVARFDDGEVRIDPRQTMVH